jgi:hypothetical protein
VSFLITQEVPEQSRSLPARIGALSRWAYHRDEGLEQLSEARKAFQERFANESEKKLYYARLALASAKARARKSGRKAGAT